MATTVFSPQTDDQVLFKPRSAKSRATARKRSVTPLQDSPGSESGESGDGEDDGSRSQQKKRRKTAIGIVSSSANRKNTALQQSPPAQSTREIRSTSPSTDLDETALLGTTRSMNDRLTRSDPPGGGSNPNPSTGVYKLPAQQQSMIVKNPNAPPSKFGPQKANPSSFRMVTFTDYAPDVCKDYKQTGFCGFGDSCKFLHAREDYKAGWALDRDWEVQTKGGKTVKGTVVASANRNFGVRREAEVTDDDKELEKIPFACIACKGPYKNPVMTKCGHYFCEACALKRYQRSPNCEACGAGTGGVFNGAKNLKKLLERKTEREKHKAEEKEADEGA